MRKIVSEQEREKKRKRNNLFMSIFLLAILVLSTAGYALLSNNDSPATTNSGTGIQLVGNRWIVPINGIDFAFTNSPADVKDIPVEITSSISSLQSSSLYISSSNTAVISEVVSNLGKYVPRIQNACYGPCEQDLPEKDCTQNLIVWKDSPENKVYQDQNCIFIEGDLRAVDAFLYKILGL